MVWFEYNLPLSSYHNAWSPSEKEVIVNERRCKRKDDWWSAMSDLVKRPRTLGIVIELDVKGDQRRNSVARWVRIHA